MRLALASGLLGLWPWETMILVGLVWLAGKVWRWYWQPFLAELPATCSDRVSLLPALLEAMHTRGGRC